MTTAKPRLSLWQIINMNVGFFGIQFSFGLQQANMSPIYQYLGADEGSLPLLWLAGPMTGLLVQPVIGAMSDRTVSRWGRRTPYFLIGALLCSLGLLVMPFSPTLWFAASVLWILDAANNVTMEPYRAYVSDRLDRSRSTRSAFLPRRLSPASRRRSHTSRTSRCSCWLGMNKDAVGASNIPHITLTAFVIGAIFSFSDRLVVGEEGARAAALGRRRVEPRCEARPARRARHASMTSPSRCKRDAADDAPASGG